MDDIITAVDRDPQSMLGTLEIKILRQVDKGRLTMGIDQIPLPHGPHPIMGILRVTRPEFFPDKGGDLHIMDLPQFLNKKMEIYTQLNGPKILLTSKERLNNPVIDTGRPDLKTGQRLMAGMDPPDHRSGPGHLITKEIRLMNPEKSGAVGQVKRHLFNVGIFPLEDLETGKGQTQKALAITLDKGLNIISAQGRKRSQARLIRMETQFLNQIDMTVNMGLGLKDSLLNGLIILMHLKPQGHHGEQQKPQAHKKQGLCLISHTEHPPPTN